MTTQQLYQKVINEQMSKNDFLWNVRRDNNLSTFITNTMSFDDTVKVLKAKGHIAATEEVSAVRPFDFIGAMRTLNEAAAAKKKLAKKDLKKKNGHTELDADHVNYHEFTKGWKHELEHTDDIDVAKQIALDHLAEDPNYYTRLDMIEYQAKKEKKKDSNHEVKKGNVKDTENQMVLAPKKKAEPKTKKALKESFGDFEHALEKKDIEDIATFIVDDIQYNDEKYHDHYKKAIAGKLDDEDIEELNDQIDALLDRIGGYEGHEDEYHFEPRDLKSTAKKTADKANDDDIEIEDIDENDDARNLYKFTPKSSKVGTTVSYGRMTPDEYKKVMASDKAKYYKIEPADQMEKEKVYKTYRPSYQSGQGMEKKELPAWKAKTYSKEKVAKLKGDAELAAQRDPDAKRSEFEKGEDFFVMNKKDKTKLELVQGSGFKDRKGAERFLNNFTSKAELNPEDFMVVSKKGIEGLKRAGALKEEMDQDTKSEIEASKVSFIITDPKSKEESNVQDTVGSAQFNSSTNTLAINLSGGNKIEFNQDPGGAIHGTYFSGDEKFSVSDKSVLAPLSTAIKHVFDTKSKQEKPEPESPTLESYIRKRIQKAIKLAEDQYSDSGAYNGYVGKDVVKKKLKEYMARYEWGYQNSEDPAVRDRGQEVNGIVSKMVNALGDEGVKIFNDYAPEGYEIKNVDDLGKDSFVVGPGPQDRKFYPNQNANRNYDSRSQAAVGNGGRIAENMGDQDIINKAKAVMTNNYSKFDVKELGQEFGKFITTKGVDKVRNNKEWGIVISALHKLSDKHR